MNECEWEMSTAAFIEFAQNFYAIIQQSNNNIVSAPNITTNGGSNLHQSLPQATPSLINNSGGGSSSSSGGSSITNEHVNNSQQQHQQLIGGGQQIRLPHHPLIQQQQQHENNLLGTLHHHQQQQFGNFLHSPLLGATMQVPGSVNEMQNVANSTPQDLASIQQYVMLMNQQQQQQQQQQHAAVAAALQNQTSGMPNSLATNAILFNALNRSNDPNNFSLSALQSPSVDLSQAAFALNNERRTSAQFLPPSGPPSQASSIHPQLTPVHQTPPMMSPLLQAAVQHQQHQQQQQQQHQLQHPPISQQSIEELAALTQMNPNLLQANLLNELQREVHRQQQAAAAAAAAHQQAQHFQNLQAALQQANLPPGHAQQLLNAIHQQQQQNQQQQMLAAQQGIHGGMFNPQAAGIRPSPMKPPMPPPQASPLMKHSTSINSSPINGVRFIDEPSTSAKKLSQPQLSSMQQQHQQQSTAHASTYLPKRASFPSQPTTSAAQRKGSIAAASPGGIQNLPKPIPTPIAKAPSLNIPQPSFSSQPHLQQPGPSTSSAMNNPIIPPPPLSQGLPQQPYYPTHFLRGTSIRLESGETRLIEDMKAEDFYKSSLLTSEMRVCIGEITEIKPTQCCRFINISYKMDIDGQAAAGSMTASAEYPFYETENGWSSHDPFKTLNLYGLKCKKIEVGDKCILLSKDFADKDDAELKKKWQKQFKGQFKNYSKTEMLGNNEMNDHPMMERVATNGGNQGQNRLVRKSIPPPLAMNSTAGILSMNHVNGPTTSQTSTSDSTTPLTSTISAPADTYLSNHAFSILTPNEPFSAPAAMDDLTVDAQMAQAAYAKRVAAAMAAAAAAPTATAITNTEVEAMQVDEEEPSPSTSSTATLRPPNKQNDDVFLDFSI